MRRPLLIVAVLYIGGILLGHYVSAPLLGLFAATYLLGFAALIFDRFQQALLACLLVAFGWLNMTASMAELSPHDLRRLLGDHAEYVSVRGKLCDTPELRLFDSHGRSSSRTMAEVSVSEICRSDKWVPAVGKISISTPGLLGPEFYAGRPVEITGVLRKAKGPLADGLFDYRNYLRRRHIHYQLVVESTLEWRLGVSALMRDKPPYSDRFLRWAKAQLSRGLGEEDESVRLLWAMTLGWKTALTDEVSEPFMQSGTLHIFAISGLHIALISGILVSVLRVMRLSRAACGLIVIPMLWFYTAATGWQPSAIRSTIMMSVIIGGWSLRRPPDLVNSVAAAAFIILLWEPEQLFQASFQLSFAVVLSIALFLPPLEALRQRLLKIDPFLPAELRPPWQRALDVPVRYLTASISTSIAAWLGSVPLTAYYFHLITPVSLLANVLIVPLSGFALMSSLASLLCGDWLAVLAEWFNHGAWFWMRCMIVVSEWSAALPKAYAYVAAPSLLQFATYYMLLGTALSGWLLVAQRRRWVLIGAGVLALGCGWERYVQGRFARMTVLPIPGNTVLFDAPGRKFDLLVDCSSESGADSVLTPFLQAQGINRLPPLLLTHGDLRHVGGYGTLIEHFATGRVLTSPAQFRSAAYRKIIAELEKTPARWKTISRGDCIGPWKVLHPDANDRFNRADDMAIVLQGEFHGVRVLLLSDLGRMGQWQLLEREPELRADIVVSGIPSRDEPLSEIFLESINPRLIIIASAEYPSGARASSKLRARLGRLSVPVIYTSEAGAVSLMFKPTGWELRAMNDDGPRGTFSEDNRDLPIDQAD